jgi:LmbE family N-acetylglucosaminyl deacetylase
MATVVAFHAHPDDEVLLTGGTLARLAAEGHRVVIAVATDGIMGPATGPGIWSGTRDRLAELRASAAQLGAARVVHLGYADSGHGPVLFPDPPDRPRFVRADPGEAAAKLAALIQDERADLRYDAADIRTGFSPRSAITHRVRVRRFATQKRAALAAHQSFLGDGRGRARHLPRAMVALPAPLFGLVFGREWFVEPGARPP